MGLIGKLFNSTEVVEDVGSGVDKLFYTNEEKADNFFKLMQHYEPFKLAQRYLALLFTGVYLSIHVIVSLAWMAFVLLDRETSELMQIAKWNNDNLFYIVLTITAFYFSGGVINGALKRFGNKTSKK